MKIPNLSITSLKGHRLILIPYTLAVCKSILDANYTFFNDMQLQKGNGWPDEDVLETLPRIINNLNKVPSPTGFESWMIIKLETGEIIGDVGFKGFNTTDKSADLGYGIIEAERQKGFAKEACELLLSWAFTNNFLEKITASCLATNIASIKTLQKLDFIKTESKKGMQYWTYYKK